MTEKAPPVSPLDFDCPDCGAEASFPCWHMTMEPTCAARIALAEAAIEDLLGPAPDAHDARRDESQPGDAPRRDEDETPYCPKHRNGPSRGWCLPCKVAQRQLTLLADAQARGQTGAVELPESVTLADLLAEPDEDVDYLIHAVWPKHGHMTCSAYPKAGKTTLRINLIRSLVDGEKFLGRFEVAETVTRVVVLDLELSRKMSRRWLRRQGIKNTRAVVVHHMRGQAHTLDVRDPRWRRLWVERLRGADVVILDCLDPVLDALDLNKNTEARQFLTAWERVMSEAGVGASLVIHHHGHGAERARGDSGILGYGDGFWDIVCEKPNDLSTPRYFRATGRDVDVPEGRLEFDKATGRLRYLDGATREAKAAESDEERLLRALGQDHERRVQAGEQPKIASLSVEWNRERVDDIAKSAKVPRDRGRSARDRLCEVGLLIPRTETGPSHKKFYTLSAEGLARAQALANSVTFDV